MAVGALHLRTPLLALTLAACAPSSKPVPPAPPGPLPHLLGGCWHLPAGCGLKGDARLRFWVPPLDEAVRFEGAKVVEAVEQTDGTTYVLRPDANAERLRAAAIRQQRPVTAEIALVPVPPSALAAVDAQMRAGHLEQAMAALEALPKARQDDADVMGLKGRLLLRQGDFERAAVLLRTASEQHAKAGHLSAASNDMVAAAYIWIHRLNVPDRARAPLEVARWHPEGEARRLQLLAGISGQQGQPRAGLRHAKDAWSTARKIGDGNLRTVMAGNLADHLLASGQVDGALHLLEDTLQTGTIRPCLKEPLRAALGWLRLRNARVKGEPIGSALADLNAAVQPDCHRPAVRANTLLNQAFGALAAGDVAQAQAALGAVDVKALSPQLSIWYRHAHAAMNLATGKADAALAAYLDMSTEPVEVGLELSWRTWLGRADAHAALNQTDRRIAALQAAERLLDSAIAEVPAQLGRSAFVIDRQRSARDLVGALVQAGRHQAALIAARRARARVWLGTERSLRADTPERAAALVAYRKARAALEADLAQDLTRTEAERVTARQNRRARAREAVQLLDAALEGGRAQELPARSTTHPSVLMHPVPSGWAIFVWQGDQLDVHSVRARPDEDDATLAQRVWQTVAPRVRAAGVVDLMPMGRLRAVDFHGLPDGSNALAASIEVRYALDLPPASPSTRQGVVVVADPRLDLPGAVVEGQAVKAAAGADAQLLRGDAATPAALTAALKTSRRLHYAGHGVFSEQALASQLPLANGTALTAADILAMPQVPVEVVLSGCETSKAGRGLVDTVGLAQAFLAAGAEAVIATTRRVKDTDAQALSAGLYGPNAPASLSKALHLAQKKLQASKADWQSFRVLIR